MKPKKAFHFWHHGLNNNKDTKEFALSLCNWSIQQSFLAYFDLILLQINDVFT